MALKIILPFLALVGQIASQDQDAYQLYRSQENLDELPVLPDEAEEKSALLSGLFRPRPRPGYGPPQPPPPPPQCRCPFGYSMCAQNPYDQNEVGCIVYCYRTYYPSLDLNKYRWVCPAYRDPFNPYGNQFFPLSGAPQPGAGNVAQLALGAPQPGAGPLAPRADSVSQDDAPPALQAPYK